MNAVQAPDRECRERDRIGILPVRRKLAQKSADLLRHAAGRRTAMNGETILVAQVDGFAPIVPRPAQKVGRRNTVQLEQHRFIRRLAVGQV